MDPIEEKRIEEVLSYPILLSDRIRTAADEAGTLQAECADVAKQVDRLSGILRSTVRFATSGPVYDRPVRRIAAEVTKSLERALALVRKCKKHGHSKLDATPVSDSPRTQILLGHSKMCVVHSIWRRSVFDRVVRIVKQADFRKITILLDASIGDMRWLMSILDHDGGGGGIVLSLPPIASNDPILSWVWSYIASLHSPQLSDRIEAANELALLARDNDRNKKMIAEEGGVAPLLKLLKEISSPDAQIAAATSLFNLANDQERVRIIADELGVPVIVQVLGDSPMRVQIWVANLVARMAENDSIAKEEFARENVIRPLVTLLSFEAFVDDLKPPLAKQSIHSIVQINKEMDKNPNHNWHLSSSISMFSSDSSGRVGNFKKDRENEPFEVKHKLKISCAEALWKLARGSVSNSRRITETKGLLCLAKLIEKEQGELKDNCLMAIMEITAAAETNADLRRAAFKTNSAAAKSVVDQLLRVVKEFETPALKIPALKSIGSLARTFSAREIRIIGPLVEQLSHSSLEVAMEAAIALKKFACSENFLRAEHSKTIIEFNGILPLMKLLRSSEKLQFHALVLLCYLAINAGDSEALERARVLLALEGADRTAAGQNPEVKELVAKAIYHLNLYHAGVNPHRHSQRFGSG